MVRMDDLDVYVPPQDVIIRYNQRQMRNFIARGMAHWYPDVLRQFVHESGIDVDQFLLVTEQILETRCTRFAEHSQKWSRNYTTPNPSILDRMIQYPSAWEGFASSDPWFNARGKKINYFLDTQYLVRVEEMDNEFYRTL